MSFAFKGSGSNSTAWSGSANLAQVTLQTTVTASAAGDLAILLVAIDNDQTTDGDEGAVINIFDTGGNAWFKAIEFTNGQGSAQAGATCSMWYSNQTTGLAISDEITLNFSNASSRDAVAISVTYFTKATGKNAAVEGTATLANDAAAAGSLDVTTSNIECLRIRGTASESAVSTAWTKTAAFTAVVQQAVSVGGVDATNQGIRGEYLISTGTGQASAPTGGAGAVDNASVYVAFREDPQYAGFGIPQRDGQVIGRMVGY